jgi:hypothetical protein
MARTKKKQAKPEVKIHTITLTAEAVEALHALSSEATDYVGRTVSGGAIVRALVRLAQQQGAAWVRAQVCPFVEAEMQAGLTWGREKRVT